MLSRPGRSALLKVSALAALTLLVLAGSGGAPAQAAFPGANGKIAFHTTRGGGLDVFVMDADGSDKTNLTASDLFEGTPAWSANGTRIAFASLEIYSGNYEIEVMNVDGTGRVQLTSDPAVDWYPSWSPDGTQIAFESNRDGNYEIYAVNADGSGTPVNLTNNAAADRFPAWSPDGTKIAFTSDRDGQDEVYVMDADGDNQTRLTATGGHRPDWSPDGTKIAFSGGGVAVMDADGDNVTVLTSGDWPAWSPDGTMIAFTRNFGPPPCPPLKCPPIVPPPPDDVEVFVMSADGTGATNITNGPYFDDGPDWQPIVDTDLDGCTDDREAQTASGTETAGGRRDHTSFWDVYDVWTVSGSSWTRDRTVNVLGDIIGVTARFGTMRPGGPPAKPDALAEALTPPTSATGYHADFDRGPQNGANPWNVAPPDGAINVLDDILGVAAQFGHSCA